MSRTRGLPTVLALAALALAVAVAGSGCRSVRDWRTRQAANRPPFRMVSPPIAYEIMRDNPGILILDLRRPNEFNDDNGHLRGATNIPLAGLRANLPKIAAFREETFLLYCRKNDRCAEEGINMLLKRGFTDPILIDGGIEGWIDKGMKTYLPASAVGRVNQGLAPELGLPRKETELPVAVKEKGEEKPPGEKDKGTLKDCKDCKDKEKAEARQLLGGGCPLGLCSPLGPFVLFPPTLPHPKISATKPLDAASAAGRPHDRPLSCFHGLGPA